MSYSSPFPRSLEQMFVEGMKEKNALKLSVAVTTEAFYPQSEMTLLRRLSAAVWEAAWLISRHGPYWGHCTQFRQNYRSPGCTASSCDPGKPHLPTGHSRQQPAGGLQFYLQTRGHVPPKHSPLGTFALWRPRGPRAWVVVSFSPWPPLSAGRKDELDTNVANKQMHPSRRSCWSAVI